jgi:oxaloacetate decarboxylase beta subunit
MKTKILFLLILLLIPLRISGEVHFSKSSFAFNDYKYIRVYIGEDSGIKEGDNGELIDNGNRIIGSFTIIGVNDYESVGLINSANSKLIEEIRTIFLKGFQPKFKLEASELYFIINPEKIDYQIRKSDKGRLFQGDEVSGLFKVIGVSKDRVWAVVENRAAGIDYRESDSGEIQNYLEQVVGSLGVSDISYKHVIMILIGILFIYLGIAKDYEPLLLVPIGFGIILGNIPLPIQIFNSISIYMIDPVSGNYVFNTTAGSFLGIIYYGVKAGILPPLIFLGIGAMTDFTALLSNPKSILLGAAAQAGIFLTFIGAFLLGFSPNEAASIGIIGGADGPTAIFLASRLAPKLIGPIAIAAYSYMAMVPIIQPPIMKLLTTKKERRIKMKPARKVKPSEKIIFPVAGLILTTLVAPGAIPLLGMLFFGNLLKESGVTTRLAKTASNALIDICTILLGIAVGASTSAEVFLNEGSIKIFVLGVFAFAVATACGLLFAKFLNLFSKVKMNPLIGAAGVSAVPDSARVVHNVGKEEDPSNYLLMHAMGPNVAGVIGSAIAAGVFMGIF